MCGEGGGVGYSGDGGGSGDGEKECGGCCGDFELGAAVAVTALAALLAGGEKRTRRKGRGETPFGQEEPTHRLSH